MLTPKAIFCWQSFRDGALRDRCQTIPDLQRELAADRSWPAAGNLVCELMSAPAAFEPFIRIVAVVIFSIKLDLLAAGGKKTCKC